MDEYIHVHRWEDFQHDKRRKGAPWHKEHAAQIDNDAYLHLSLAARGLLVGIRLMYGRRHPEGVSVSSARKLLCASGSDAKYFRVHLASLNHAGFITLSASSVLATRSQRASSALAQEVEVEVEVEKEPSLKSTRSQRPGPNGHHPELASDDLEPHLERLSE